MKPFDCRRKRGAFQVFHGKGNLGYDDASFAVMAELDADTGNYIEQYKIPYNRTNPETSKFNGCSISPVDDKLYCFAEVSKTGKFIVRLDDEITEFVAWVKWHGWNSGGFGPSGTYYASDWKAGVSVFENLAEQPGFTDAVAAKKEQKILDLRNTACEKPKEWKRCADIVSIRHDFGAGDGDQEYVVCLYGPYLQIAQWNFKKREFSGSWALSVKPPRWDNVYGSAWNFQGKMFFSINRGMGVHQVPLHKFNLSDTKTKVYLPLVGSSAKDQNMTRNDGFNCMEMPSPWTTKVAPFPCAAHPEPIQIMKVHQDYETASNWMTLPAKEYTVAKADFYTNGRKKIYSVPSFFTDPPFVSLNAAGINPIDNVAYGALKLNWWPDPVTPSPFYIVRFDAERIEFVAKIQGDADAIAGAFDAKGTFFVTSHPHIYAFAEIDTWKGHHNQSSPGLPSFTKAEGIRLPDDVKPLADLVIVRGTFDGGAEAPYLLSVNQQQQMFMVNLETAKSWTLPTNKVTGTNETMGGNLGSAWNQNGTVIFSSNGGEGTFKVPLDEIDLITGRQITLQKYGSSIVIDNDDGMSCLGGNRLPLHQVADNEHVNDIWLARKVGK